MKRNNISFNTTQIKPTKSLRLRIFKCIYRQKSRNHICPELTNMKGMHVLITGSTEGVGEFISRKLIEKGARGVTQSTVNVEGLKTISADLTKSQSIKDAVYSMEGERFDMLICNADVVRDIYVKNSLGLKKTFAVNVFGHHLLYKLLNRKRVRNG